MLIGIDASRANLREKTGVEWYGYHLIRELAKLDTRNRYRLYAWDKLAGGLADLPENFTEVVVPSRRAWPHTALSLELRRHPVDRLFVPSHVVPLVHPKKTVVTIHDLAFRHFREGYSWYHRLSLQLGTRLSAKWASTIVTPSAATAAEVREAYGVPADKVRAVPNGYDESMFNGLTPRKVVEVMRHHGITDPYILFLGRLETKKNVVRLLEAFYRLRDSGIFGGQLVLVGNPGVGYGAIQETLRKRKAQRYVVHTGYLPADERAALLRGARALALPSLFEGFGIPILEGFAAETPVLTADRGATQEVAGDGALLVDPGDVEAIHRGLERLLSDRRLAAALVQRGKRRLRGYGWSRTAGAIHKLITA